MNTAIQDLREDILSSVLLSTQTKTIVCAFIDNHLEKEKKQLCDFWIEGNKQGWAMQTDFPEDAENFYNETYKE